MSGKIFVLRDGEGLTELRQEPYENEDSFQSLIEQYPAILAGDQINSDAPRKWVLISREMSVPLDEGWGSLDHFYVDQEAIPTFVEVKRGTDTRIRREVVGQMLDYAANGKRYWSIGQIRELYEKSTLAGGDTLTAIGIAEENEETFWQTVDRNLRNGKIRLLFVADEIPSSLQAIIEYLNEQMTDTDVFGVEIKQFVGTDGVTKILVPSLVGSNAKGGGSSKQKYSSRSEFLNSVEDRNIKFLYTKLFAFADENNHRIGLGTAGFSLSAIGSNEKAYTLLYGYGVDPAKENLRNSVETTFGWLKELDSDVLEYYRSMVGKLNLFEQTPSGNYKWRLTDKTTETEMQLFMDVIQCVANRILGS
jgi:hypothetical protein